MCTTLSNARKSPCRSSYKSRTGSKQMPVLPTTDRVLTFTTLCAPRNVCVALQEEVRPVQPSDGERRDVVQRSADVIGESSDVSEDSLRCVITDLVIHILRKHCKLRSSESRNGQSWSSR